MPASSIGADVRHPRLGRVAIPPRSSSLKFRSVIVFALFDGASILLPFTAVALSRGSSATEGAWLTFTMMLVPTYLAAAANIHAYSARNLQDPFRAIRQGLKGLLFSIGLLILGAFYARSSLTLPRLTIALGSAGAMAALALLRYVYVQNLPRIVGGNPYSVILIRDGDEPLPGGSFSAVIAADAFFDPETHDPVMYDRLAKSLAPADRVVIACPPERRAVWARALRGANIQGEIVVPELAQVSAVGLGPDRDLPSVIVAIGPLSMMDRALKRGFDLLLAGSAAIILLPLLVLLAMFVKLDSAGPVLFKQTRIGRGNQLFSMWKFRSMRDHWRDSAGDRSAGRDDERITRAGRYMRRTSFDELPQLFNILAGSMSIVGPRPHALGSRAADKLFWEVDGRYWDRHAAKPGLTGLAQVRGLRGATLRESDLRDRLQADLEYLENWSLWRDIKIIILTLRVLAHRNAG